MALRLRGATSGYIELKAPASAGDNTLTLPTNNGSANQILKTDGSGNLSWTDDNSGVSLSGSTNNTIATVTGANAIQGEANLVFDVTKLGVGTASPSQKLQVGGDGGDACLSLIRTNAASNDNAYGHIFFENSSDATLASISARRESATDDSYLTFSTQSTGNSIAEALRITSTGKVGIGTTDPVGGDFVVENTSGTAAIALSRVFSGNVASSAVNTPSFAFTLSDTATNDQVVASISPQALAGTGDAFKAHIRIFTANDAGTNTERLRIENNGNVTIEDGDLVIGTNNHGIDFSESGGPQGSGNELLDDYEEGTFTPTALGTTTSGAPTYQHQAGFYTKVGNLVVAAINVSITNAGSNSGELKIGGWPFTPKSGTEGVGVIQYNGLGTGLPANREGPGFAVLQNPNTYSKIRVNDSGSDTYTHLAVQTFSYMRISITYFTS